MMLETERGAVLIVGCSHSTIEAIVQESVNVSGDDIALVMGGYHLLPYTEEELTGLAKRLKNDLGVAQIASAEQ